VTRLDLGPLLSPRSIAIVGASESADSWAPEIHRSLRHLGFAGELHPVNPKYADVWGLPCRRSVADLPRGVDLAVLVVPARVAVDQVEACGRAGVRSVLVVSSGFAEAGDEGRALQARLREVAGRHHLPLLGPNVEGYVNVVDRVAPYGATPPPHPVRGPVSVISQSGTVAWTMAQLASDRGLGLRIVLGVGNEAVLGLGDLLVWAAFDPRTEVVATYLETLRDVDGIGRGLDALGRARKPVLLCAPRGTSEAARRAIVAHTGALAGDAVLRDAWLRGHGAVLVEDPVELFEAAVLLSRHRRLRASGVAAAMQSGGGCTLFAEAVADRGLSLPPLSAPTRRVLRRVLPPFASIHNPLDVTGQAAVETERFAAAIEALAGEPAVGLVAFDADPPRFGDGDAWAEPLLAAARRARRRTGVAFVSVAMGPLAYGSAARRFVERAGVPFLQGHRAAAGAIRALVDLGQVRARRPAATGPHPNRDRAMAVLRGRSGPVDEATAARVLALYGVRRPREVAVRTPGAAAAAARSIGFPVAVKAAAPEVPHKARLGAVRLGLADGDGVERAAAEVLRAAARAGARRSRVLVQRMTAGTEVLVGAVVDERLGAFVTARPGGSAAEGGEPAFVAAPLSPAGARRYASERAAACGLDAERDDLRSFARAIEAIARAAHELRGRLVSLEANPLLVGSRGAVAVDALAEVRAPT
jgi:acyl-CoA synthetase (NDP forming)